MAQNWGVSPPDSTRSSAGHAQAAPRLCRLDFAWRIPDFQHGNDGMFDINLGYSHSVTPQKYRKVKAYKC